MYLGEQKMEEGAARGASGNTPREAKGRRLEEGSLPLRAREYGIYIWHFKRKASTEQEDRICKGEG